MKIGMSEVIEGPLGKVNTKGWNLNDRQRKALKEFVKNDPQLTELR